MDLGGKPAGMSDYGHTEPRRGAEWWGKSPLVTLGLFSKVTRRKGGTNTRRYHSNGYVPGLKTNILASCQAAIAGKPAPTFGSPSHHLDSRWQSERHREQAPSHIFNRAYLKLFSSQTFKSCTSTSLIV
jgi:hypothetical protein